MPFAAAISEHSVAATAASEVADEVAASIGPAPDAAVLFATTPHRDAMGDVAAIIERRLGPRTLVGSLAVSVVGGDLEIEETPAVSLWAGNFGPATPVRLSASRENGALRFDGVDEDAFEAGHTLVLLPDPFTFPVGDLIDRLALDCPRMTVIGGLASAAHQAGDNRLVLDGRLHHDGAVGFLLSGPTRMTTVVSQGCRPIGRPLVVTRSDGNTIQELAGRPAYEQLAELVTGLTANDRMLASKGLHIGRVIDEHQTVFGRGDFLIRGVLGVDPATGSVAVGDVIPVGSTTQFQVRDAASADEDLRQLMEGRAADGALMFTCNGRGRHLFSVPNHDAALVTQMLDGAPLGGMFCAGEIGPVGDRSFVHGFTASLALFHDER